MKKNNNIKYYALGNGLTVYNNDLRIAHIDSNRNITIYMKNLPNKIITNILQIARENDNTVSITQDEKIFKIRPQDVISINIKFKYFYNDVTETNKT